MRYKIGDYLISKLYIRAYGHPTNLTLKQLRSDARSRGYVVYRVKSIRTNQTFDLDIMPATGLTSGQTIKSIQLSVIDDQLYLVKTLKANIPKSIYAEVKL